MYIHLYQWVKSCYSHWILICTMASCSLLFFQNLAPLPGTTCCSPSSLSFPPSLPLLPFFQHFALSTRPDNGNRGSRQPPVPSSQLNLFTEKPMGSRVNPTTWHRSVPARGMPMSASIAALFICSLLSLFYSGCLHDCTFLSVALSFPFLGFFLVLEFPLYLSAQQRLEYLILSRCLTSRSGAGAGAGATLTILLSQILL